MDVQAPHRVLTKAWEKGHLQPILLTPGDNRYQAPGDSVHFQPDDIRQCAGIRKC
jgi:hypothetical protein